MTPLRSFPGWIVLMGALTAIGPLSIDMYLPSFPAIAAELDAVGRVELTLASFFTGLALGQLFYGPLSDRFGRKPPLYLGLALFTLASLGAAWANDIHTLVFWRFVQGLGGCAGMVIARAVVRDRCSPAEAARAFSLLMLVMGLAPILAPLAGSYLLVVASWRTVFVMLALFGGGCLLALWRSLAETHPGSTTPLRLSRVLAAYGRLLRDPVFMSHTLASALVFTGLFAYIAGSPFVLMQLHGVSPQHYGWIFGSNALGLIVASQINARLLRRYGMATLLRQALRVAAGAGLFLTGLALAGQLSLPLLLAGLFTFISAMGFIAPNASAQALAHHGAQAGTASALMGALQFLLATLAGTAMSLWHDGSALPMASALGLCGIAAWLVLRLIPATAAPAAP